jgi:hypothetical protein
MNTVTTNIVATSILKPELMTTQTAFPRRSHLPGDS